MRMCRKSNASEVGHCGPSHNMKVCGRKAECYSKIWSCCTTDVRLNIMQGDKSVWGLSGLLDTQGIALYHGKFSIKCWILNTFQRQGEMSQKHKNGKEKKSANKWQSVEETKYQVKPNGSDKWSAGRKFWPSVLNSVEALIKQTLTKN